MAAQSPIARFFVPAQKAGKERAEPAALASSLANSPPQTPGPRAPSLKDDALSTPPSIESRKRPLKDSGSEPKKMKAGSPNKDAVVRDEDITEGGPPSFATPQRAQEGPKDLRATLQLAERSAPGSIPPFTAECFHHFENGGSQYSWPAWLRPENLRDAQGLRPTEPGYNQGTLWVPDPVREKAEYQKAQGHNTPMLMQYWKLKSKHFDKVAFFKVGKFYEIFYYDAFIAQRICNLKWMGQEKKPHVGFPEMAKHEYARRVVEAGFKVVVVEQVERVVETNQRKTEGQTTGPTCVERDVCEVYTNGTLVDPELLAGPGSRFLAYLFFEGQRGLDFAACLVDCATSQIQLGHFNDAPDRNRLRTMLAQLQPSEIVYDTANLPIEVLQLLKRLPCRPQLSSRSAGDCGLLKAREMMNKYRAAHPKAFTPAVQEVLTQDSAVIAAAGIMDYLEAALLAERLLPFATWDVLATAAKTRTNSQRMILDATALSALEVVETLEGGYEGSLLAFLDHTSTPFGFRLLKQWVCAPLLDLEDIQSRQEAVEYFLQNDELSKQLRASLKKCIAGGKISKLPVDLERATSRIWSYALQAERKAVMYDDITARRLGHFVELMEAYEQCYQLLSTAFPAQGSLPGRLAMVAKPQKAGGILPELMPIISKLRGSVVEATGKNGALKFRPQDGADPVYDQKSREIHMVKSQLDKELQRVKVKGYEMVHLLAPLPYAAEAAWLMLLLYISKVQEQEGGATLPTGFRSVMYIDVFGWIKRARAQKEGQASPWEPRVSEETRRLPSPAEAAVPQPGRGPALDAVHYDGSILKGPAPRRPELLPGAAKPPPETLATKEMFDPTTFVPREKDGQHANHAEDIHPYLKPGVVPWRIFCSATTLLLVLWWISGVLVLLQSSGWSALRVSPLLHDSEEGPAPIEQTQTASFLLEEVRIQPNPIAESLHGEHVATFWPPGASPRHLSCASADGAVRFAASSRFGLFEATLNTGLHLDGTAIETERCARADVGEGSEALQDLSLLCSGHDCHAQVLHRQGQRLASCALGAAARAPEAVMSLGDTWLGQGDAARDESQEEVSSLAMMDRCISGSERCAYAETTGGRLVELKSGLVQGSVDWLPTRVLLADVGRAAMRKGAALHTLGDRYLAMLVTGGRELRVFDLRQSGKMVQRYPLPAQKQWSSMCSAGSNLYLLSEDRGEAAQIFRFPLPQSLLPPAQTKPAVLSEKVKAAPTQPPMTLASAYTQPKEELLENAKASDVFGATWLTSVKDMKISGLNIPKHL
ncbi:MSH6 [Symbiodinium microadriaticum]|nr:MSH6 [Symbiodinium microadriaticum]